MPRQNRVDPFGNIVAHPAYGMLMGNRGCLHDDQGRIVRTSARDAWITCLPNWPGVHRDLMTPGHYTELFFLDEATAMAAGHRPCGSCRPAALLAFKQAWQQAFGLAHLPRVGEIDAALRSVDRQDRPKPIELPQGAMIASGGKPFLRWGGTWLEWTLNGYDPCSPDGDWAPTLITSTPMLLVLHAGYQPVLHGSAAPVSWVRKKHAQAAMRE